MYRTAGTLHALFNVGLALVISAAIMTGLQTLWHMPLAVMLVLIVIFAFLLLYANAMLMGLRMQHRWRRQMRAQGWRRRPDGRRWGNDDDDDRGGLAGERVPRHPVPPTLSARIALTPDERDDYLQPRS